MDGIASDELAVSEPERPERPEFVYLCKLAAPRPSGGGAQDLKCGTIMRQCRCVVEAK